MLALVPALLGGGAGIAVLGSLVAPLALADDGGPTPAWSLKIHAAFPLALSPALPPAALLAAGTITDAAALRWAAVPVGIATGIGLALGFGHLATARLRRDAVALLARLDTRVGVGEEA